MTAALFALGIAFCLGAALGFLAGKEHEWNRLKRELKDQVDFLD